LREKRAKGDFAVTPPLERLKEVELFISSLTLKDCFLASDHLTNYLWAGEKVFYRGVAGELPGDEEAMLKAVRRAIEFIESTPLEIKDSNQLYEEGLITAL
jgi:hypothetical protein